MPSTYKRKSQQHTWDSDSMEKAIRAVRNEEMGFLKASKKFKVPRSTLIRRVKGIKKDAVENKKKYWGLAVQLLVRSKKKRIVLVLATTAYLVSSATVVLAYKNCPNAPVCATNGETYKNACDFRTAQIEDNDLQILYEGNCKNYVVLKKPVPKIKQNEIIGPSSETAYSEKPRISMGKLNHHDKVKLKYKKRKQKKIVKTEGPSRKPELGWSSITRKRH